MGGCGGIPGSGFGLGEFGQAEVQDLAASILRQKEVFRLEVTITGVLKQAPRTHSEPPRVVKALAILLATVGSLWACGAFLYVHFVGLLPPFDPTVEIVGLLISLFGMIAGGIALRFPPRRISAFTMALSVAVFLLFFFAVVFALISGKSQFHRSVSFPWAQP